MASIPAMVATVISTTSQTTSLPQDRVVEILALFGICFVVYTTFALAFYAINAIVHIIKHVRRKK